MDKEIMSIINIKDMADKHEEAPVTTAIEALYLVDCTDHDIDISSRHVYLLREYVNSIPVCDEDGHEFDWGDVSSVIESVHARYIDKSIGIFFGNENYKRD